MHRIENEFLRISAREYGAELTSIYHKKNGIEHLWQADPAFWGWHAPVLFPVVGRCLNDELLHNGQKYRMEKHGFARKSNFQVLELGDTRMVFRLLSNDETRRLYPFEFEFLMGYHLHQNSLTVEYEVINRGNEEMYFQLGGHPAFVVPFKSGEAYNAYYLEFEHPESAERDFINTDGFFTGEKQTVLSHSQQLPLQPDMFSNDAFIFKNLRSKRVTIATEAHPHFLSVEYSGFKYLGLWAKVNAPYVCIEPWLGCADTHGKPAELKEKEGVITLEAGKNFVVSYTITAG